MAIAIDTNILFDILLPDPEYKDSSMDLLIKYARTDKLLISEIVYSELASQFMDHKILDSFLHAANIFLENTTSRGLWLAARAWKEYTEGRGKILQCSKCGNKQILICKECEEVITTRQHIISDFIIAGHALEKAEKLVTRDRGFYREYFQDLDVEYS